MIKVVILGTGNVAGFLFEVFSSAENVEVLQVYNHSAQSLVPFRERVKTTTSVHELEEADLYLMAVKDDAIPELAAKLNGTTGLLAHTSGSISLDALGKRSRTGVFYPLQTFSKNKEVTYKEIPVCLEAKATEDLELLKTLAGEISAKAFEVSSEQRRKLHLAAVFVCNFVNHLYTIGEEICEQNELPFEILQPLIKETAEKVSQSSPSKVQTGPAKRGDQSTIEAHLDLISSEENKKIYQLLTHAIQSFYGKKL